MKRIKVDGKSKSKFELCCMMGYWKQLPWSVMCDAFDYAYIAQRFIEFADEKGIKFQF